MKACEYCGTTDWDIYGQPNGNYPGWFKHWCCRAGCEIFLEATTPEHAKRMRGSAAASRANADSMRHEDDEE